MPKTLRGKFTLVYSGLALMSALVGLAGIWNLYRLEQSINNLMTANYKSIDAVSHMMEAIERQDSGALIYISVDKTKGIEIFTDNGDEFQKWYNIEKGNVTEHEEQAIVDNLEADYSEYSKTIYSLQESLTWGGAAAQEYYTTNTLPLFEKIKAECRQLININEQAMFASKQRTTDSAGRSMVALLILSLAAIIVGYAVSQYYIRLLLNPIKRLSESISRVREGDLNQQVVVSTRDEAGILAGEFNEMTRRLQGYEQSNVGTLMAEKQKSMAIVRSISDPLLVLDTNWRILIINDACEKFFGLDGGKVAGRHFLEVIHNGELFENIEALADVNEESSGKIISITKESEYFFNLIVTKVNDPDIRNSGIIVAFQNVTGLKELERVRTDFLATISHEFKTPLTSIMMAASILHENGLGSLNAEQAETVDTIREDGDSLLGLVNDLLELMKIESGRDAYHYEACSINAIVDSSVRSFAENARVKGVALTSALEGILPQIYADYEKIRWVINNLISNALKHTKSGDTVTITASHDSRFVYIAVKDTGAGIPPEYLDKIFDKFVQVEEQDILIRGTGLGLSISKEILHAHGGDIRVSSEVGTGSIFVFSLPIARTGETT